MAIQPNSNEFAVLDELGNTVGLLVSNPQSPPPVQTHGNIAGMALRYPIPCSKQASITTDWLNENFEESMLTSVPRSVMFEEYVSYCYRQNIKPFNQAVFGKVVRACFPNLITRRLGVRGQSRYHYAGLNVKHSSIYAEKLRCSTKRMSMAKASTSNTQPRKRDVGAHVTIDGTSNQTNHSDFRFDEQPFGSIALVLPPYPSEDDMKIRSAWSRCEMASFLDFYRSYNRKLLGYVISLDFEKTSQHVRNFGKCIPEDCCNILKTSSICNIIAICDDIMFQEATAALLPDCLATLTSEFNVSVRKFAKTLPLWIEEELSLPNKDITKMRISSARQWSEHVRRVTTLCHVAKEARKTLTHPAIVSQVCRVQLLSDLRNISIKDIAAQCAFAGGEISSAAQITREQEHAQYYMKHFCRLLQSTGSYRNSTRTSNLKVGLHKRNIVNCAHKKPYIKDEQLSVQPGSQHSLYNEYGDASLAITASFRASIQLLASGYKQQANVEVFARELEILVNKHGGLRVGRGLVESSDGNADFEIVTDQTKLFIMKWAMYGSKILTEITLKSSESVGTFHLLMLLFGDYVTNIISMKNERKSRIERLRSVIKEGSSYFKRLWVSSENQALSCKVIKQDSVQMVSPKLLPFAFLSSSIRSQLADSKNRSLRPSDIIGLEPHSKQDVFAGRTLGKTVTGASSLENNSENHSINRIMAVSSVSKTQEPAVIVESAFSDKSSGSFYLVPGKSSQPSSTFLVRK